MNKQTPHSLILSLVVITLGPIICITSILPDLKNNHFFQGALIIISIILLFYISIQLYSDIRSKLKTQQNTKKQVPTVECWKIIVAESFSIHANPEQRELIEAFIISLFTRIETSRNYCNSNELRKDIYQYIKSPLEMTIEYITPITDPVQINKYQSETFKIAFEEFRLLIGEFKA